MMIPWCKEKADFAVSKNSTKFVRWKKYSYIKDQLSDDGGGEGHYQ